MLLNASEPEKPNGIEINQLETLSTAGSSNNALLIGAKSALWISIKRNIGKSILIILAKIVSSKFCAIRNAPL